MQFYKLTHPTYITDDQFEFRNPVSTASQLRLPGIECPVCGRWASSNRLRVGVPAGAQPFGPQEFVTPAQWMLGREGWARLLGVSADELAPRAEVGPPMGQCTSEIAEDVVHPMPGIVWVRRSVREAMNPLTGVSFADVQLDGECDAHLAELVIHGRAWRRGSTTESLQLCHVCGRTGFPNPRDLSVDEARWDGSDFITVDDNPNIVIVTERVALVLDAHRFSNVAVEPIA